MLAFRAATLCSPFRVISRSRLRVTTVSHKYGCHRFYSESAKPVEEDSSSAPLGSTGGSTTSTQDIFGEATGTEKLSDAIFEDQRIRIAPKSKGWPNPWINKYTFTTYMEPLYAHGWGLRFLPRTQNEPRTLCVSGMYRLKGWYESMKFLEDLQVVFKKEKHHPVSFSIRNHAEHADITILIQTHSAYRPANFVEVAAQKDDLKLAGVTMRDVRLAALVHELWRTEYSPSAQRLKQLQVPDAKESNAATPSASKESELVFNLNAKSQNGPWTPASMRPTWGQLEYAMVRCDGTIPKSIFDWALAEANPKEQRVVAQPKYDQQQLF